MKNSLRFFLYHTVVLWGEEGGTSVDEGEKFFRRECTISNCAILLHAQTGRKKSLSRTLFYIAFYLVSMRIHVCIYFVYLAKGTGRIVYVRSLDYKSERRKRES